MIVGRKRKFRIKRQPNGQPSRERGIEPNAIAQLMPHRRLVPAAVAHDPKAESIMGRLCLNGWLTEQQYQAGIKYREVVMRYRAVIDAPRGEVSMSGVIVGPWSGSHVLDDEEATRRRQNYMAAFEALEEGSGNVGARAVANCAVHERRNFILKHAKAGLNALVVHFGLLTSSRKSANAINMK